MYRLGDNILTLNGKMIKEFPPIQVTDVVLNQSTLSFTSFGSTYQLTYNVLPSNAANKSVTFSSSNTNVATVSSTGLVTSIDNGDAVITITTVDGSFTDTCNVNVSVVTYTIASGGIETYDGDYKIHSFKTVGTSTFTVTQVGTDNEFEYLIVAGGGSGGGSVDGFWLHGTGGGGAGGMLEGTKSDLTTQTYSIVVGAGGSSGNDGNNGGNSSAFNITAIGGGRGASTVSSGSGGSGGGGSWYHLASLGIDGQGNAGDDGIESRGGGGGGKNGAGTLGVGGAGKSNSITGSAVTYATGGSCPTNTGNGISAAANTGNGGGGAYQKNQTSVEKIGGNGGSGIVIVKYKYK